MSIEEIKEYINPCLKCGNKGIIIKYKGSFSSGKARCSNDKCGNIMKIEFCDNPESFQKEINLWIGLN